MVNKKRSLLKLCSYSILIVYGINDTKRLQSFVNSFPHHLINHDSIQSEHESSRQLIAQLWLSDPVKILEAAEFLKNVAIGSNKQKEAIIELGLVPRFLQILDEFNDRPDQDELLTETTATINSLAKGTDDHSRCLIEAGTVPILLSVIMNPRNSNRYIEISLKALRSLFNSAYAPLCLIYEWREGPEALISRLLYLASGNPNTGYSNQECVCNLLAKSIESEEREKQKILSSCGAVSTIADLLLSPAYKVQMSALNWLSKISYSNGEVSRIVVTTTPGHTVTHHSGGSVGSSSAAATSVPSLHHHHHHQIIHHHPHHHAIRSSSSASGSHPTAARRILNASGVCQSGPGSTPAPGTTASAPLQTIPDILSQMMSQEKPPEMQLMAAKCMAYLYRAGAVCSEDKRIVYKTLPTLIRCCKRDKDPKIRSEAADVLSYLTEVDTVLQQTAAWTDQVIPTIGSFFKYMSETMTTGHNNFHTTFGSTNGSLMISNGTSIPSSSSITIGGLASTTIGVSIGNSSSSTGFSTACHPTPAAIRKLEQEIKMDQELKASGFKVFASLGSQDEEIRKKIFETESLMDHIVSGLSDSNHKIRFAALKCLHSLSRSVQQLRTNFSDHAIWIPLRNLLSNGTPDEILILASSTLCNLLLEFSPSKQQHFMERSSLELLCSLSQREEPTLRMNGVWALMNMVYKADQASKLLILTQLGMQQIFRLINDPDVNVVMKTLGLLRNLLSTKPHIDHIMTLHGKEILDAILMILDTVNNPIEVKEQALCVLANIADGESSKDIIMNSEEILMKLNSCLEDDSCGSGDQMITDSVPMSSGEPIISITLASSSTPCHNSSNNNILQNQSNNSTPIHHHHHNNNPIGMSGTSIQVLPAPLISSTQGSSQTSSASSAVRLQIAATFCITNLVWAEEEGSAERQKILKEVGIYENLTKLLQTTDTDLFDKVKTAHSQFSRDNN